MQLSVIRVYDADSSDSNSDRESNNNKQGSSQVWFSQHCMLQNKPKNIEISQELKEILKEQYLTHSWADFDDLGLVRKPTVSRKRTRDEP